MRLRAWCTSLFAYPTRLRASCVRLRAWWMRLRACRVRLQSLIDEASRLTGEALEPWRAGSNPQRESTVPTARRFGGRRISQHYEIGL